MRKFLAWFVPIFIASVAAFAVYKMATSPRPRPVPDDEVHATYESTEVCLECHAKDGPEPQSPEHPVTKVCMDCH